MSTQAKDEQSQKQTLGFQTEVKQLLNLMINSLYSNKEIFLRELISNASDAEDKLRFKAIDEPGLYENDNDLKIWVDFDKEQRSISITDNGIGLNWDDAVQELGTIAQSGTKSFINQLSGDQSKDSQLIGQFGVGFYSAFIVAQQVVVESRKAGLSANEGVRWSSTGEGEYTVEPIEREQRGTTVTLYLREGEDELLEDSRIRSIITKYSDHIDFPIMMQKMQSPSTEEQEGEEGESQEQETQEPEWEQVNQATALWTLPKNEISDDQYKEFYKHIAHDFQDPLTWVHNKVEGKLEYTSLLYIPSKAPFDLYQQDQQYGLKLYVQRVFILDNVQQFLPGYLRFVKGIVDSNDLPLNISREILQSNKVIDTIRSGLTKRVLNLLEQLSEEPDNYQQFWNEFGRVLKTGPAEDFNNRDKIAKLLRFASTHHDTSDECVSLDDYIARMKDGQDKIYYITAESFNAAKHSPHLEIFRKKGIEVLLLSDPVDEWLVAHLTEYEGKQLQSVAKGDLDLGEMEDEEDKQEQEQVEKDFNNVVEQMQNTLDNRVKEVRVTHRLTDSPACIVVDEHDMNANMQRILQSLGQPMPESKPIFEINPDHKIVSRLKGETDDDQFAEWTNILFEQAVLAEGGQLEDPAKFVQRLNKMLMQLS